MRSKEERKRCYRIIGIALAVVAAVVAAVGIGIAVFNDSHKKLPRFQLRSVSVSLDDNPTAAVWEISFSIDKPLGDLTVWIRFMARDYKVNSVGTSGNSTVSVTTPSLPAGGPPAVLDQVMFRCNNYDNGYLLEAACENVTVVGFSSSTRWVMEGSPRLCPVVRQQLYSN